MVNPMRTIYSIILLAWPMALLVSAQQPDEAIAAAIRAKEREWVEAQSHNNNQALNLILDNALVYVEYGRLVSKGDYLSRIRQQDASTNEVVMDPLQIQTFGNTAIVTGTYREVQRTNGTRVATRWRFVDTWTHKKNGWVLIAAGSTPIR